MLRHKTYVHMCWRAHAGKFRAKQTSEAQKQRNAKQRNVSTTQLAVQRDCSVTVVAKQRKATSRCRGCKALVQHKRKPCPTKKEGYVEQAHKTPQNARR